MQQDGTIKFNRFLGVRNTLPGDRMQPTDAGGWLPDARNIDIDNANRVTLRQGHGPELGFGAVTAAYTTRDEQRLFVVEDGGLKQVVSMAPLASTTLVTGVGAGEVYWAEAGNMLFVSGAVTGVIDRDQWLPLGIPTPEPPAMNAIPGSLPPGRYLATMAYRDAWGREGGIGTIAEIELTAPGGIQFNFAVEPGYTALLFATLVNGDDLYLLAETTSQGHAWTAGTPSSYAIDPAQVGTYPPPAGIGPVAFMDSRLWVSSNEGGASFIFRSQPFWYHLFDLADYIPVPGRVEMLLAVDKTLIIGTRSRIHAYNEDTGLETLAEYGVVPGQPGTLVGEKAYFWTARGLCSAFPFENITDAIFSVAPGTRAATGRNESRGRKMLIVATDTGGQANNPN